jgi:hypothetical protein
MARHEKASVEQVLEVYRVRWQVELTFKRFKSIAQIGHVAKHDDQSSRAWRYGKLLVASLSQKLASIGKTFPLGAISCRKRPTPSPWREFEFALHQVLAAITPRLPLASVMRRWNEIAEALSEPNRNRRPQLESLS